MRADSSSFSNLPRTSSIASASISEPCLPNVSGNTTTSTLPAMSSSMKTAMRSPFLVFSGRRPETMPPTQTSASDAVELGDPLGAEGLQLLGEALERMAAHVEAERFLLERRAAAPRSTAARRAAGRPRRRRRRPGRRTAGTAPCRDRADGGRRARSPCRRRRTARRGASRTARCCSRRERVERAGLDQALEHPLVDQPQVDVLAQRVAASRSGRAPCARASIDRIAPSPTFFTAHSPKRTPSFATVNAQLARS